MLAPELFTESLPIIGTVPLVFFIPVCPELPNLNIMIERYGGAVSHIHECFSFQIAPQSTEGNGLDYFEGSVFSAKWLIDSVKAGKLLERDRFVNFDNKNPRCLKLEFSKNKVRFTIREAIKVFEIA